jgi:Uma2 family endonuclease
MTSPASFPEIMDLLPAPGEWTESDYYPFSERGRLVELSDGNLEVPDLPTEYHQLILLRLSVALHLFVTANKLGQIRFAPLPVRLWSGKIREPDLMFMSSEHAARVGQYWGVPDLAVEILSPGTAYKDREIKRKEYARAGVTEYWIVDPEARTIDLMRGCAGGNDYESTERFHTGGKLSSGLFPGFALPLAELFAEM